MRKKVFGKKLNRNRRSRAALFRALAKSMILYGEIKTTKAKSLAVRPNLDKLISFVKKDDLAARRMALSKLGNERKITDTLFEKYSDLAKTRDSGFTKMSILPNRGGDNAEMRLLSWVESKAEVSEVKEEKTG